LDDEKFFKLIKKDVDNILYELKGGPKKTGEKLKKLSYPFLSAPDPTMVSTMIGITLFTTGTLLSLRRKKGLNDIVIEKSLKIMELYKGSKRLLEKEIL